tara:strand:+ start:62 stop:385 length:324 start_codon:yes stop_codon:yes gene_type:complete
MVDESRKNINMGRADENDLVVKGNLISRIHARVEMRRRKFLLIDQSTNGTFLENAQGEEIFVRRDSSELSGEGIIGLGRQQKQVLRWPFTSSAKTDLTLIGRSTRLF